MDALLFPQISPYALNKAQFASGHGRRKQPKEPRSRATADSRALPRGLRPQGRAVIITLLKLTLLVKLDGVVEYKSLPSGLHNCESDLVYFVHEQYAGISAFANRPAHESERNAHFAAVGVLVPLTYGRLGRSWLHARQLRHLVGDIVDHDDSSLHVLEEYWDQNRVPSIDGQEAEHGEPSSQRKRRALSDAAGLHPSNPTLSHDHPAMSLARHLDTFGPLVFPLQRATLLKKRILIMSPAPVHDACNLVYNLSVLSNIPPLAADAARHKEALYPLRPLFNVGIRDIDYLSQLAAKSKPHMSWIACSTDDILGTKSSLYDVLVELPNHQSPDVKQWPRIRTSTGEDVKATQRDLRRYYTLKRELNKVQHPRPTAYHDTEDESPEADNDSDSAPLNPSKPEALNELDQYVQLEGESSLVEPSSWASIAYTSFLWWASAGEKDALLDDEACQDARLLDDLPLQITSKHDSSSGRKHPSTYDKAEGVDLSSQSVAVTLIAYAHRITTMVMETLAEIIEAADAESEHGGESTITITIHSEDMRRMGLDEWSHSDGDFVKEMAALYFARENVHAAGRTVDLCGIKC
ncbi:hypothetical protein E4T47_02352 [Aureobasidium subglaciale]|nr:hypothetical protein E4T47_02352 [Aureobasidium subglaciale]